MLTSLMVERARRFFGFDSSAPMGRRLGRRQRQRLISHAIIEALEQRVLFDASIVARAYSDTYSIGDTASSLTVSSGSGLLANDYGSSIVVKEITKQPLYGSVTFNANGSFTYTPNSNFLNHDQFYYRISDGTLDSNGKELLSNIASVDITGNMLQADNLYQAIIPVGDPPASTATGVTLNLPTGAVADYGNANDADDQLTFNSSSGTVDFDGDISTGTPAGWINFRKQVGSRLSNKATLSLGLFQWYWWEEEPGYGTWYGTGTIEDITSHYPSSSWLYLTMPHNQSHAGLAFGWVLDGGGSVSVSTQGAHGTASINSTTGAMTYTPTTGFVGRDQIGITVQYGNPYDDYNSLIALPEIWVTVEVGNNRPQVNSTHYSLDQGTSYSVSASSSRFNTYYDPDNGAYGSPNDTPNNKAWIIADSQAGRATDTQLSKTSATTFRTPHGSVTVNTDYSYTYTPDAGFAGQDYFSFASHDGIQYGNVATEFFTVSGVVDLDADTDNSDRDGTPARTVAEEDAELSPGKFIIANAKLQDSTTTHEFVPVVFQSLQSGNSSLGYTFTYDSTRLKLWTHDASTARTSSDLIVSGTSYTASQLGLDGSGNKTFYVQAIKAGAASIEVAVSGQSVSGNGAKDKIVFMALDETVSCVSCATNGAINKDGQLYKSGSDAGVERFQSADGKPVTIGNSASLIKAGNGFIIIENDGIRVFDFINNVATAREADNGTIEESGSNVIWHMPTGAKRIYRGTGTKVMPLIQSVDASGTTTDYNYTGDVLNSVTTSVSGVTHTQSLTYNSDGLVSTATVTQQPSGGSSTSTNSVAYSYYGTSDAGGPKNALKLVTTTDTASGRVTKSYYRYYKAGDTDGFEYATKLVIEDDAFNKAVAAFGSEANVLAATDSQLLPYATDYFKYDSQKRVSHRTSLGTGCSTCGSASTITYAYEQSSFADGSNSWKFKTTQTLADGTTKINFANYRQETLMDITVSGSSTWRTYYRYDDNGNVVLTAGPSAVTGHDQTKADLVDYVSNNAQYLSDSTGLINISEYYSSTTATGTTAGGVAGYLYRTRISKGETGTAITEGAYTYFLHQAGSQHAVRIAEQTQYANTNETGGRTTSYSYTLSSGTTLVVSETVTLPTVSTANNGSNTAATSTTVYDSQGRPIWTKDADGFLTYSAYDNATGALIKSITDVDTTQTSTFNSLPSGWTTPSGGGLHLTSTYEVDVFGRTTKSVDAKGNITYTVYNDAANEVRTYRGWNTTTNQPTGPVEISRQDLTRGYSETLTASWSSLNVSSSRPVGNDAITSATIHTLSRSISNVGGQLIESRQYHYLTGLTYTQDLAFGTVGTNYYSSTYGYDKLGRSAFTKSATGTITHSFYDALGRTISTWIGTDDVPSSDLDSNSVIDWRDFRHGVITNGTAPSGTNLVKVSASEYDNGGVGDGNLTKSTQIPGGSEADRVTKYHYDWRNRLVATKTGVKTTENASDNTSFISYTEYNNLGESLVSRTYDGDTLSITDGNSDGVPDLPTSSALRAYSTAEYDELGRAFKTSTYSVDPSTGTVSSSAIVSQTWFNQRGMTVKSSNSGQASQKMQYDGAGRTTKSFVVDASGDSSWADALTVTGDTVLEQSENTYDANGNVILSTVRQRFHDASGTGELGNPSSTTQPKARVSYSAAYYDLADRLTDSVNVGTNGGSTYSRPSTVPTRSDTVLVTSYGYNAAGWTESVTDPKGLINKTFYDNLGRTTKTVENYVDGTPSNSDDRTTLYTYTASGQVATLTADMPSGQNDQTTEYIYGVDSSTGSTIANNDLLLLIKRPSPTTGAANSADATSYAYNALGETLSESRPNGGTRQLTYDVLGRNVTNTLVTTDSSGSPSISTQYNALGWVVGQTDARGYTTNYTYDGFGRVIEELRPSPDGVAARPTTSYEYDIAGRMTAMIDPRGHRTEYTYDLLGRRTSITTPDPDGSGLRISGVTTFKYYVDGDKFTTTHPFGNEWGAPTGSYTDITTLDRFDRVASTSKPSLDNISAGPTTSFTYDRNGNALTVTNPLGHVTSYAYDGLNRVTSKTTPDPDGTGSLSASTETYTYDALDNMLSYTDGMGRTTNYAYDSLNRRTEVKLPSPGGSAGRPTTTYAYDVSDNLTSTTDANGRTTTHTYNQRNLRTQTTAPDPDGAGSLTAAITTYGYDLNGNLTSQTDPLGNVSGGTPSAHTTTYTYDRLNRLTTETLPDPDGSGSLSAPTTTYTYDAANNLLTLTDPVGNTITYTYDPLNRKLTETNELNQTRSFAYDAHSNLLQVLDRNGLVRQFDYDTNNRRIAERWVNSGWSTIRTISYTYDDAGQLTEVSDPSAGYEFTYDNADRLTQTTITLAGISGSITLGQAYNSAHQRTLLSVAVDGTNDLFNRYSYDGIGRMSKIEQFDQATGITAGYLASSSTPAATLAAKRVDFGYNDLGQRTAATRYSNLAGSTTVASTAYTFDNANRLTNLAHTYGSSNSSYGFTLDVAGRISAINYSADGNANLTYDANGQLLAVDNASLADEAFSFDENGNRTSNSTVTTDDNRLQEDAVYTYTYDSEGNLVTRAKKDGSETVTYTWDYRNRLSGVEVRNSSSVLITSATYEYDAFNRRVARTMTGTSSIDERYMYDGTSDANLLLVLDNAGDVTQRYFYSDSSNEVLAEETVNTSSTTVRWALSDHLFTVRDVLDNSGALLNHVTYSAFGAITSQTSTANMIRQTYTGGPTDVETGFGYLHNRYHDPITGRWISQDPIKFEGGDTNLYRYVENEVAVKNDPSGLQPPDSSAPSGQSVDYKMTVEDVVYEDGSKAKDFVKANRDGAEVFSARLTGKKLDIAWTDFKNTLPENLREAQTLAGGPSAIEEIEGFVTDRLADKKQDLDVAARLLRKSLGGSWNVTVETRGGRRYITAKRLFVENAAPATADIAPAMLQKDAEVMAQSLKVTAKRPVDLTLTPKANANTAIYTNLAITLLTVSCDIYFRNKEQTEDIERWAQREAAALAEISRHNDAVWQAWVNERARQLNKEAERQQRSKEYAQQVADAREAAERDRENNFRRPQAELENVYGELSRRINEKASKGISGGMIEDAQATAARMRMQILENNRNGAYLPGSEDVLGRARNRIDDLSK